MTFEELKSLKPGDKILISLGVCCPKDHLEAVVLEVDTDKEELRYIIEPISWQNYRRISFQQSIMHVARSLERSKIKVFYKDEWPTYKNRIIDTVEDAVSSEMKETDLDIIFYPIPIRKWIEGILEIAFFKDDLNAIELSEIISRFMIDIKDKVYPYVLNSERNRNLLECVKTSYISKHSKTLYNPKFINNGIEWANLFEEICKDSFICEKENISILNLSEMRYSDKFIADLVLRNADYMKYRVIKGITV